MNILLIQLPHPILTSRNVPLAAGYLKAYAGSVGLLDHINIEIMAPEIINYGGCQLIIDEIIDHSPKILGATIYSWNKERTIYIMEQIKRLNPNIITIIGGPEVTSDSYDLIHNKSIDITAFGEGECKFSMIVDNILRNINNHSNVPGICYKIDDQVFQTSKRKLKADLKILNSPYLLGYIPIDKYKEIMIQTMRGCLQGCLYCGWTAKGPLRELSLDQIKQEILFIRESNINKKISIIDSAFNTSPFFTEICEFIRKINYDKKLQFTCFVQVENVNAETAKLLKECNFTSVEVGLQSTNKLALKHVNRSFDRDSFERGIKSLKNEGIHILVDVILGLPYDSLLSFNKTLKYVYEKNLEPIIFNLSLSYGSNIRKKRNIYYDEYQSTPPYYVLSSQSLSKNDFLKAMDKYYYLSADLNLLEDINYPLLSNEYSKDTFLDDNIDTDINKNSSIITAIILNFKDHNIGSIPQNIQRHLLKNISSKITLFCTVDDKLTTLSKILLQELISNISVKNKYIKWSIFLKSEHGCISQDDIDEIYSFIPYSNNFISNLNELFPNTTSKIREKNINIFSIIPFSYNELSNKISEENCIIQKTLTHNDNNYKSIYGLLNSFGYGILVSFSDDINFKTAIEMLELIYSINKNSKAIYFSDIVIQRYWIKNYRKATPDCFVRNELSLDKDMNCKIKNCTEIDLLWHALSRWDLVLEENIKSDIKSQIIDKALNIAKSIK